MTPTEQAARWLADVQRYELHGGNLLPEADALAAIARHLAPGDDLVAQATAAMEGVTEGPWKAVYNRQTWGWVEVDGPSFKIGAPTQATDLSLADEVQRKKDARFIAFARQWVPEAAAHIAALTAERDALDRQLSNVSFDVDCEAEDKRDAAYGAAEWQRRALAAEAERDALRDRLARMEGALTLIAELTENRSIKRLARAALTDGGSNG